MSHKIIIEGVYQWNDKTNRFDTVYEDSIDYDGDIIYAQEGPDGKKMGEEAAEDFDAAFEPTFADVEKSFEKDIAKLTTRMAKMTDTELISSVSQLNFFQELVDKGYGGALNTFDSEYEKMLATNFQNKQIFKS